MDEFILFDQVQYTKNDWRNRNRIKTAAGLKWLTIPVRYKFQGKETQRIDETRVAHSAWAQSHWETLKQVYKSAKHFSTYAREIQYLYENAAQLTLLSEINEQFILGINRLLGITTKVSRSTDYPFVKGRTEQLVSLCRAVGATEYLSGPKARAYLEEDLFRAQGIQVRYKEYAYPEYEQRYPPFLHEVSILDLLFNLGEEAPQYIWGWRAQSGTP